MSQIFFEKMNVFGPVNKIYNYCYIADYLFNTSEINFFNENNVKKKKLTLLFVDPTFIEKYLRISHESYDQKIFIMLWNGIFDFKRNEKNINQLMNRFKDVKIISIENSKEIKGKIISNNIKIQSIPSLKKINGVSLIKKIKYFYPTFSSLFNFFRYIKHSIFHLRKNRLVFVGTGDTQDFIGSLKFLSQSFNKYSKIIANQILDKLANNRNIDLNTYFDFFKNENFKKMDDHEKNFLVHLISRYLIVKYLLKFDSFFHQNKSKVRFDILHCNIFKKIVQIDFGAISGNSKNYTRSLILNRFYKNSTLKIILLKNSIIYDENDALLLRIDCLKKFIENLYKFNEFDCSQNSLINHILKLKTKYLDNN